MRAKALARFLAGILDHARKSLRNIVSPVVKNHYQMFKDATILDAIEHTLEYLTRAWH
jgi:hypothetical protein